PPVTHLQVPTDEVDGQFTGAQNLLQTCAHPGKAGGSRQACGYARTRRDLDGHGTMTLPNTPRGDRLLAPTFGGAPRSCVRIGRCRSGVHPTSTSALSEAAATWGFPWRCASSRPDAEWASTTSTRRRSTLWRTAVCHSRRRAPMDC